MDNYYKLLDYPDVGEMVSFYATDTYSDSRVWQYHYALTFRSTYLFESEGRAGDGCDVILAEGRVENDVFLSDDEYDIEEFLSDFADSNAPAIPPEVESEFHMDDDLCAISEYLKYDTHTFEDAIRDELGIEDENEMAEYAAMLKEYADNNGWTF